MICHISVFTEIFVVLALFLNSYAQRTRNKTTRSIQIQNTTASDSTTKSFTGIYCRYQRCYYKKKKGRQNKGKVTKLCSSVYGMCKKDDGCCGINSKTPCCNYSEVRDPIIAIMVVVVVICAGCAGGLAFYFYKIFAPERRYRPEGIIRYSHKRSRRAQFRKGPPRMGHGSLSFQADQLEPTPHPENEFPNQQSTLPSPSEDTATDHTSPEYRTSLHPSDAVLRWQSSYSRIVPTQPTPAQ